VVLTCVENEEHQVGIKMVADVFEMNGWESFFIGTGIPTNELIRYIHEVKPDLLAISLSVYFNYTNLLKLLKTLRTEFHTLQFIVGGQAFNHTKNCSIIDVENVVLLSDLYLLEKYIKVLNTNH
jgi:methanogenic corrinoid protein MtbC1